MDLHAVVCEIEGHVGCVKEIVCKEFLYHILLVSQTDDEIMEAELRVILHNMPQNGLASDFNHGLGL